MPIKSRGEAYFANLIHILLHFLLTRRVECDKINNVIVDVGGIRGAETVGGERSGESPMECRRCKATRRRISQAKGQSRKEAVCHFSVFVMGIFFGAASTGSYFYFQEEKVCLQSSIRSLPPRKRS